MPPSREYTQLEKETNATIKLIMIHMEQLASLHPAEAAEPYSFEARRQQVMRKIWNLIKFKEKLV